MHFSYKPYTPPGSRLVRFLDDVVPSAVAAIVIVGSIAYVLLYNAPQGWL